MIIGIPKEIKEEEARVAATPSAVAALVAHQGVAAAFGLERRDVSIA